MEDVAKSAGVSTATVSRVLRQPDVVSDGTREKVMRAITALDYQPNLAGMSLRTRRTGYIIVTVPDISNPFFSKVIRGIEEAVQAAGYAVLLGDTRNDAGREEQYALMLRRKQADGLVFLGHRLPQILKPMIDSSRAAPIVNACEFDPDAGVPSVHIDNFAAAAEATHYLCELGHNRIGVITGPMTSPLSRDRLDGTCKAAGSRLLHIKSGDFSIDSGEALTKEMLLTPNPPTAIFCFSDEMAIGAISAARSLGLACPTDISVVGFDDIRIARSFVPALTTIQQPMEKIGRKAVQLLLDIIDGRKSENWTMTLPYKLMIRNSTAPNKGQ